MAWDYNTKQYDPLLYDTMKSINTAISTTASKLSISVDNPVEFCQSGLVVNRYLSDLKFNIDKLKDNNYCRADYTNRSDKSNHSGNKSANYSQQSDHSYDSDLGDKSNKTDRSNDSNYSRNNDIGDDVSDYYLDTNKA